MKNTFFFLMALAFISCNSPKAEVKKNDGLIIYVYFQDGSQKQFDCHGKKESEIHLERNGCIFWDGHGVLFCGVQYFGFVKP